MIRNIMRNGRRHLFIVAAMLCAISDMSYAQQELQLGDEVLITNNYEHDIFVTLIEAPSTTVDGPVTIKLGGTRGYSFTGNSTGFNGDPFTKYIFEITVEETIEYLYVGCDYSVAVPDGMGFYCPNEDSSPNAADIKIIINSVGAIEIDPSSFEPAPGTDNDLESSDHFSDDNWIAPYNLDTYCAGTSSGCEESEASWFLTPQTSLTTYTFTDADLTQPSDEDWTFEDITLTFPSSRTMAINKGLEIDNSTVKFEDDSGLVFQGDSDAFDPVAGTVFKMGNDVRFTFESAITLAGTSGDEIVFEPLDAGDRWEYLDLKADGNDFDWVIFDGGGKTVEVRSDNNTFDNVTFKNGTRGISSYYSAAAGGSSNSSFTLTNSTVKDNSGVGVVAYHTDLTIDSTDVTDGGKAGIWITSATVSPFTGNLVENNALTSTTRDGIEVHSGGVLDSGEDAFSVIKNNTFHEVSSSSSGQIDLGVFSGGSTGGYNDIYDKGTQATGEKYIAEGGSYDAVAENNCWDTTSAPAASFFGGTVDYDPFVSCSRASKGGRSPGGKSITERIREAQEVVVRSAPDYRTRDVARLYTVQQFDRANDLGLLSSTLSLIRDVSRTIPTVASPEHQAARERAMLTEILHSMTTEDYDEARGLISEYEPGIRSRLNVVELLFSKLFLFEQEKDYDRAMGVVTEIRARSAEKGEFETTLSIIEETLLDRIEDETGSRPDPDQFAAKWRSDAQFESIVDELDTDPGQAREVLAAYPNPFNPATTVTFDVAARSHVSLVVFDVLGRRVAVLADGIYDAGSRREVFQAGGLPSGSYLLRLSIEPVMRNLSPVTVSKPILLLE